MHAHTSEMVTETMQSRGVTASSETSGMGPLQEGGAESCMIFGRPRQGLHQTLLPPIHCEKVEHQRNQR